MIKQPLVPPVSARPCISNDKTIQQKRYTNDLVYYCIPGGERNTKAGEMYQLGDKPYPWEKAQQAIVALDAARNAICSLRARFGVEVDLLLVDLNHEGPVASFILNVKRDLRCLDDFDHCTLRIRSGSEAVWQNTPYIVSQFLRVSSFIDSMIAASDAWTHCDYNRIQKEAEQEKRRVIAKALRTAIVQLVELGLGENLTMPRDVLSTLLGTLTKQESQEESFANIKKLSQQFNFKQAAAAEHMISEFGLVLGDLSPDNMGENIVIASMCKLALSAIKIGLDIDEELQTVLLFIFSVINLTKTQDGDRIMLFDSSDSTMTSINTALSAFNDKLSKCFTEREEKDQGLTFDQFIEAKQSELLENAGKHAYSGGNVVSVAALVRNKEVAVSGPEFCNGKTANFFKSK